MVKNDQLIDYLGKIPPQAIEVEKAVLGALLLESETFEQIKFLLKKQSFYKQEHQTIFEVIENRHKAGKATDMMLCTMDLRDAGKLDEIGGVVYITQLANMVATAGNIEHHARILTEKFAKRELIRFCSEMLSKTYDDSIDILDIINEYQDGIKTIDDHFAIAETGKQQKEVVKSTLEEICDGIQKRNEGKTQGITTGFRELNRSTGGWRETNFIILAARPGVGKTSLALHFAKKAGERGHWVNFFSYEMAENQLEKILIAGETNINRTSIRDCYLNDLELTEINKAAGMIEDLPIIWNSRQLTIEQIENIIKQNKKHNRCDLVIIDYIQLIKPTDSKAIREQQISHISRSVKQIALTYKIPVIALSQLNREIEKRSSKKPILSDLRESGSMEQDADMVIFPFVDDEGYFLSVAKNRNGKTGDMKIFVNDEFTKFGDIEANRVEYGQNIYSSVGFVVDENPF